MELAFLASSKGIRYHTNIVRCLQFTVDMRVVRSGDQTKKSLMEVGIFANSTGVFYKPGPANSSTCGFLDRWVT